MNAQNLEKAVALRHELHMHPELSLCETQTKQRLMDFVRSNTSLEILDQGNFFAAVYKTKAEHPLSTIAFRADMDALPMDESISLPWGSVNPGVSHKCGHDGHAASLAGFALTLEECGADRDVYLLFQHAEEIGAGGAELAAFVKEEGIPMVYGTHNWSGFEKDLVVVRTGVAQCASMGLTVRFTGKPSHASEPEHGINPSAAISLLGTFIDDTAGYAHSSEYEAQGRGLVLATIVNISVGTKDFGMSASSGEISATLRAEHDEELALLRTSICDRASALAAEYGLIVSFEEHDVFPDTTCTANAVANIEKAAALTGHKLLRMEKPIRASEDFGHILKVADGALFYLGNGEDYPAIHTVGFDFPDFHISRISEMFLALTKIE